VVKDCPGVFLCHAAENFSIQTSSTEKVTVRSNPTLHGEQKVGEGGGGNLTTLGTNGSEKPTLLAGCKPGGIKLRTRKGRKPHRRKDLITDPRVEASAYAHTKEAVMGGVKELIEERGLLG